MANFFDYISLRIIVFILAFLIFSLLINSFLISVMLAICIVIAYSIITKKLSKHKSLNYIKYSEFVRWIIINGQEKFIENLLLVFNDALAIKQNNYIVFNNRGIKEIIFPIVKFGKASQDDLLKIFNIATSEDINTVYMIFDEIDKKTFALSQTMSEKKFYFVNYKSIYQIFKNNNILPDKAIRTKKSALGFKPFLGIFFSRTNLKGFIFSAIILSLMSYITPLRKYYIILAIISIVFSLLCITNIFENIHSRNGIFEELLKKNKK